MREIKFRAWDIENKYMKYDVDFIYYDKTNGGLQGFFDGGAEFLSENIEWMQYTGLKDKNGVEIYEGDIVRSFKLPVDGEVLYRNCAFRVHAYILIELSEVEVIGNIYENPELLKQ